MTSDGSRPLSGAVSSSCTNSRVAGRGEARVGSAARAKKKENAVFKKAEAIFVSCKRSPEVGVPGRRGCRVLREVIGDPGFLLSGCSATLSRGLTAQHGRSSPSHCICIPAQSKVLSLLRGGPHALTPSPLVQTQSHGHTDRRGQPGHADFLPEATDEPEARGSFTEKKAKLIIIINLGGQPAVCGRGSGPFLIPVPSGRRPAGALGSPLSSEPLCVSSRAHWDCALDKPCHCREKARPEEPRGPVTSGPCSETPASSRRRNGQVEPRAPRWFCCCCRCC